MSTVTVIPSRLGEMRVSDLFIMFTQQLVALLAIKDGHFSIGSIITERGNVIMIPSDYTMVPEPTF